MIRLTSAQNEEERCVQHSVIELDVLHALLRKIQTLWLTQLTKAIVIAVNILLLM
jgi:hypothetical protein